MKDLMSRPGKYLTILTVVVAAFLFLNFLPIGRPSPRDITAPPRSVAANPVSALSLADSPRLNLLYDSLQLDSLGLTTQAYHKAIAGFLSLVATGAVPNPGILSIIDFSLPSTQKRLFILDTYSGKLLFNSLVAHGRNSGTLVATRFSNRRNSFMSSLGFYLTGEPFIGQHGYSLRLEGMEKGWNDNVFKRSIIMHPAEYVSEDHIRQWGLLGRSEGCPAIPQQLDRPIIDVIRGGSCLFVYSPDKKYLSHHSTPLRF